MAVRRLAPKEDQPESFAFTAENLAFVKATIAKYPEGRQASAVIPVLWRAQEQMGGWLPEPAIRLVADMLGMNYIRVLEVATFYTQFILQPVGKAAHVQVCGTTPCMLRGAEDIKKVCRNRIHHDPFHLSADGKFSWEEVECLGACVNAPMVMIGKDTYEDLTPETFSAVLDAFGRGETPPPGPQVDRQFAAPIGGETTLREVLPGREVTPDAGVAVMEKPKAAPKAAPAPAAPAPAPAPAKLVEAPAAKAAPKAAPAAEADEAPVGDEFKPTLLTAARGGKADDLKLIWGVGPKLEAMLHKMGVYHFDQIAGWNDMNLKWVDQNLEGFKGRAVRDKWVEQSAKLATGWRPEKSVGDKPE